MELYVEDRGNVKYKWGYEFTFDILDHDDSDFRETRTITFQTFPEYHELKTTKELLITEIEYKLNNPIEPHESYEISVLKEKGYVSKAETAKTVDELPDRIVYD